MNSIGSFIGRLTSRKFLLTIFGIVAVTVYPEQAAAIVSLIVAFVGAEGAADAVSRYSQSNSQPETQRTVVTTVDDDEDVDVTGTIVTGKDAVLPSPVTTGGQAPL